MSATQRNLFLNASPAQVCEEFTTLLNHPAVRIERIASHGESSPPDFWYDQPDDEWVLLLQGQATLSYADGREIALRAGDWEFIAKHVRHRVAQTSQDALWLAVHCKS